MIKKIKQFSEIFSLEKAAQKINCSQDDLFRAGGNAELELLVVVPEGMPLRLGGKMLFDGTTFIGEPALMRVPNLLMLSPNQCWSISLHGKTTLDSSPKGYNYGPDGILRVLQPSECDVEYLIQNSLPYRDSQKQHWKNWVVHDDHSPSQFEVTPEMIRVTGNQIEEFLQIDLSHSGNIGDEFKSNKLQYLNQAARRFWGAKDVIKEDPLTHPKTKKIVDWLCSKGFTRSLAESAASIIRPEFAAKGRPIDG